MAERDRGLAVSDREVDSLVEGFGGDTRRALAVVMHDLALLVDHYNATASRGFVRRQHGLSVGWSAGVERGPSRG